jgi:hypothetical protein
VARLPCDLRTSFVNTMSVIFHRDGWVFQSPIIESTIQQMFASAVIMLRAKNGLDSLNP